MSDVLYPPEFRLNPEQLQRILVEAALEPEIPTVVNRHHYKRKRLPPQARYIGRRTPLGNPYTVKEHGQEAMELYCRWLIDKLRHNDADVLAEMRSITPATLLVCSCKPRPCHGDVVLGCWVWMKARGMLGAT